MPELVEELKIKIIEHLNLAHLKPEEISAEDSLFGEGLGLDSIDAIELLVILESEYGITVEDAEQLRPHFVSLNTLAQYVQKERKR